MDKKDSPEGKTIIKSGLEIHQQLDTGKLYCRCPSILRQDNPDWIVKRKLHAVAGESGEVDIAAKHESQRDIEFVYQGYKDTCCLVEFDEEPPHEIDKEALKIATQIALLLNCEIVQTSQIMRKTVIDGSNTSGFQRTFLLGRNGFIETSFGRVSIDTVFLEEDSARPPGKDAEDYGENSKIWKLDRLGIPLVEIATGPHINFPEQVKEVALKIGEILRSCKVKRGIGTIRQDINISTKNHPRVELKGFQDPAMMKVTSELEANRQQKMFEIHEKINKHKKIEPKFVDLTEVFANTNCKIIKNTLEKKGKIFGIKVNGFSGVFGTELYDNRRFGSEASDYAKIASGVGGIIHSDEKLNEKYNFSDKELKDVRKKLDVKEKDAFVIVADDEKRVLKALNAVVNRVNLAIEHEGLKEVRKANTDGSTSFMRPMPGAARMYPETDLPLIHLSRDFINEVKKDLPKLKVEIAEELKSKGLSQEMINLVLDSNRLGDYESLLGIYYNPNFVAKTMLVFPKEIASHEKVKEEIFSLDILEEVLKQVQDKKINESDVKHILEKIAKGENVQNALKVEKMDVSDMEGEIAKMVKGKPGLNANAYMGLVMAKFKGKIDGKTVMEILKKLVK
jgi:glutamyl-tRNA(Gln) amidotransferase subunit E